MHLVEVSDEERERLWDAYVSPRAVSLTDCSAWRKVLSEAYGIRSYFLAAAEGSRIAGVLGLYEIRHFFFGHYLLTAPFGNDGGYFADDEEASSMLLDRARQLADELDADYLLIRSREQMAGFQTVDRYVTALISLAGGKEAVWGRTLRAKTRNQVRKGRKEGFTISSGPEEIPAFHRVLHRHMRDLGSPGHSLLYYQLIQRYLGDKVDFLVVREGGELVAGALVFQINRTAVNYHAVSLRPYNRRCPNYLLYWRMLENACAKGLEAFDMGRSAQGSSVLEFKRNWGPILVPLYYNFYLRRGGIPNLDPHNPRYRVPIECWKRLPVFLTRALGPTLLTGLA